MYFDQNREEKLIDVHDDNDEEDESMYDLCDIQFNRLWTCMSLLTILVFCVLVYVLYLDRCMVSQVSQLQEFGDQIQLYGHLIEEHDEYDGMPEGIGEAFALLSRRVVQHEDEMRVYREMDFERLVDEHEVLLKVVNRLLETHDVDLE